MNMLDRLPYYIPSMLDGVSADVMSVVADWLLDNGRNGDAALVRASWRADTWRVYRDDFNTDCILISLSDSERFRAACALAADEGAQVYEHRNDDSFDFWTDAHTNETILVYKVEGELTKRLDIEKVVELYSRIVKHPQREDTVFREIGTYGMNQIWYVHLGG